MQISPTTLCMGMERRWRMIVSTTGSFHAGLCLWGYPPDKSIQQVDDWLSNLSNTHRDQSVYDHYARMNTYMHILYHIFGSIIRSSDRESMERFSLKVINYITELLPLKSVSRATSWAWRPIGRHKI
jgi:hypothetical protein